jgi:hypothetical protein
VQGLDITTGLFEIGSFLLLEQLWQGPDKIRILMGDETTRRTKKEIVESLRKKSDASIEGEKERDDALETIEKENRLLKGAFIKNSDYSLVSNKWKNLSTNR